MRLQAHVHIGNVLNRNVQRRGDITQYFVRKFAVIHQIKLVLDFAQIEKEFFLRGRCTDFDQRPRIENIFLYRGLNPPQSIGGKTKPLGRLKFVDRIKQTDIALRNHFAERQSVSAVFGYDLNHQTKV